MTFYIYLFEYRDFKTGKCYYEASAETFKSEWHRSQFLFECPEAWLPLDQAEFLRAAKHYGFNLPADTKWFGYVPF